MTLVQIILSKHGGKRMLVDTNLWLLLLIGNFDRSKITSEKRTNSYTEQDFDLLKSFISFFKLIVTPNILTEVSNLANSYNETSKQRLFAYLGTMIEKVEEEYVPSANVNIPTLRKFGLSDSVIDKLAESGIIILTADFPLYHYLSSKGLIVLNFNHIRSEYLLK